MTRETKIGLLVGLAFLLVVGILLSEHITGASDRPAAPLADAGRTVRDGMSAPGAATDEPKLAEPQQPVPSPSDLTPKAPVSHVTVTPPSGAPTVVDVQPAAPILPPAVQPPSVVVPAPTSAPVPAQTQSPLVVRPPTDPFANDPIGRIAKEHGETIVPVENRGAPIDTTSTTAKPTATAAREYKAQPGDNLSRLASLLPGGNVKANRDAVVALNPTLQKDPNRVVTGRSYLLPTAVAAKPAEKTGAVVAVKGTEGKTIDSKSDTKTADAKAEPKLVTNAADVRVYVVKAGDTLSKIASIEMGSKSEVGTLRKLNADVLKGSDTIKIDMKLKLPAKLMASVR